MEKLQRRIKISKTVIFISMVFYTVFAGYCKLVEDFVPIETGIIMCLIISASILSIIDDHSKLSKLE